MKKSYWITIAIVFAVTVGAMIWMESRRSRSQDVTVYKLVLPKPDLPSDKIVLLDLLNERFREQNLKPVGYFQGFQSTQPDGQIVAGSFSYSQIDAVRKKLEQVSAKRAEIEWTPVFEGRVHYGKPITISETASLKLNAEPYATPVEATVKLSPEAGPLTSHFYDGHTRLFGKVTDDKIRILFITTIFPPDSSTKWMGEWFYEIFH